MKILLPIPQARKKPVRFFTRASVFMVLVFAAGCRQRDTITLAFPVNSAVAMGTPLLNNGVAIGRVIALELIHNRVIARVEIYHRIKISRGSTFNLRSSLLGSKSIEIEMSGQQLSLTPVDTIIIDANPRKVRLQDSLRDINAQKAFTKIVESLHELFAHDSLSTDSISTKQGASTGHRN